jgi:hypothetical protein
MVFILVHSYALPHDLLLHLHLALQRQVLRALPYLHRVLALEHLPLTLRLIPVRKCELVELDLNRLSLARRKILGFDEPTQLRDWMRDTIVWEAHVDLYHSRALGGPSISDLDSSSHCNIR